MFLDSIGEKNVNSYLKRSRYGIRYSIEPSEIQAGFKTRFMQ